MNEGIIINTGGGTVITGGNFENVEFVANKYVVNEPKRTPVADIVEVEEVEKQTAQSKRTSPGRKIEPLFQNKIGEKDDKKTEEMALLFTTFLRENHLWDVQINTSKKNAINSAFVDFYCSWAKDGHVAKQPNGMACYRFLTEDCGIVIDKAFQKTYAEFIRKLISERNI